MKDKKQKRSRSPRKGKVVVNEVAKAKVGGNTESRLDFDLGATIKQTAINFF